MDNNKSSDIPEKLIDVEALFASKNPALLKIIPGFVFSYLKKIIHQEEVNRHVYNHRDKVGLAFPEAILSEFGVPTELIDRRTPAPEPGSPGMEPLIPPTGRYIVAANHPLGGMDGMALMHELGKWRTDLIFPVNDLLMNLPGLRPLFIPINKHGRNTENARLIDETFSSGKMVLYFPAGLVSRKQKINGKWTISDLEWKNTFIKKAKKYGRDILPIYIEGQNSDRFYNISLWRKRLGIRANIEMLYLVDEMMRQRGKVLRLHVGNIIPHQTFDKSKTDAGWANWVRDRVYAMEPKQGVRVPSTHDQANRP